MKKLICIVVFPIILLFGCGDGGSGAGSPSKVAYSDKAGKGTVENYTNAEWLYQNYFGEYGVPLEFKESFMPAIKMLANGFALQLNRGDVKQGDDVMGNIGYFHKQFLQFVASGEAVQFVKSMPNPSQQQLVPSVPRLTDDEELERLKNYVPPPMSDDAKKAVAEALTEEQRDRAEIKKIVVEYKLPYTIEGQDAQWFIYSPTMKGGKNPVPQPSPAIVKTSTINQWNWRMGDIIWSNGATLSGIAGHVGMVDVNYTPPRAIEANTGGVVLFPNLDTWANRYTQVKGYSPKLGWSPSEPTDVKVWQPPYWIFPGEWVWKTSDSGIRRNVIKYANLQLGKPYNYNFFNPSDNTKYYCSSLVYNMYNNWANWNILAKSLSYNSIVTPADVTNSVKTTMFNSWAK